MNKIVIKGARTHNLKNINVEIPRDRLVVITGPSGSGKSSLAFDILYAEGQRRYVESLSAYARQFLEQMDKPDVDAISGLSPAIAIQQKTISKNPRSTVGTVTEIYDYLRLLFARIGSPTCVTCGKPITSQTIQQMADTILAYPAGEKIQLLAPVVKSRKGEYKQELLNLRQKGFTRARIDGTMTELSDQTTIGGRHKKHTIEAVVDRLVIKDGLSRRLADSLELAVGLSGGIVIVVREKDEVLFSEHLACVACNVGYSDIEPRLFSFNSPYGACPACDGLGVTFAYGDYQDLKNLDDDPSAYEAMETCAACRGSRLKPESLAVRVAGRTIGEVTRLSLTDVLAFISKLSLTQREEEIARRILREIAERLQFLITVGVGYLTLDRAAATLSGGEGQRIRLATQIGSSLMGILYILDEPSIGLHQRDNARLLATLKRLRDIGNTVLVVEHDEETIRAADWVIDMGPGAGKSGGTVVAEGRPQDIMTAPSSLTGKYLSGKSTIALPPRYRKAARFLQINNASLHNLKNIQVKIPIGLFTCVTGVSGSGKSTLILDVLYKAITQALRQRQSSGSVSGLFGIEHIDKVIHIDQSPIGRTPRSNPATYTGVFTAIRDIFALVPQSRMRGYRAGRYSFNVKGGRCEACQGDGVTKISMHFLPDVYVMCEVCRGKRYNRETLDIQYRGKNIADVLDMTVDTALDFFKAVPSICHKVQTLQEVGLGYITLGQPATTLSGGEAQRIKLSRELSKRATSRTLYILDEPTTGLHFADVQRLLLILNRFAEEGNTVVVIEHNIDVIRNADWIIDLGPEGGNEGGEVVIAGTPDEVAKTPASHTGASLKAWHLARGVLPEKGPIC